MFSMYVFRISRGGRRYNNAYVCICEHGNRKKKKKNTRIRPHNNNNTAGYSRVFGAVLQRRYAISIWF